MKVLSHSKLSSCIIIIYFHVVALVYFSRTRRRCLNFASVFKTEISVDQHSVLLEFHLRGVLFEIKNDREPNT